MLQCLARLGSPIAGSRDLSAVNKEDFHRARRFDVLTTQNLLTDMSKE